MCVQFPTCGRISAHVTGECASPCGDEVVSQAPADNLLHSIKSWAFDTAGSTSYVYGASGRYTEGNSSHLKMRLLQQGGFGIEFEIGFEVGPLVSCSDTSVEL